MRKQDSRSTRPCTRRSAFLKSSACRHTVKEMKAIEELWAKACARLLPVLIVHHKCRQLIQSRYIHKLQQRLLLSKTSSTLDFKRLTWALRIVEVSRRAFFAEISAKVDFARAFPFDRFAMISQSSVKVALAWSAVGVAEISFSAGVAVWCLELDSALAVASFFGAVSSWVEMVAVASCRVESVSKWICVINNGFTYVRKHQFRSCAFRMVDRICLCIRCSWFLECCVDSLGKRRRLRIGHECPRILPSSRHLLSRRSGQSDRGNCRLLIKGIGSIYRSEMIENVCTYVRIRKAKRLCFVSISSVQIRGSIVHIEFRRCCVGMSKLISELVLLDPTVNKCLHDHYKRNGLRLKYLWSNRNNDELRLDLALRHSSSDPASSLFSADEFWRWWLVSILVKLWSWSSCWQMDGQWEVERWSFGNQELKSLSNYLIVFPYLSRF